MYKTLITHRISKDAQLELVQIAENKFEITYLTRRWADKGENQNCWDCNNSEDFADYNTALVVFNRRRESADPFQRVSRYNYVTGTFTLV